MKLSPAVFILVLALAADGLHAEVPLACKNSIVPRKFLAQADMQLQPLPARDYVDVLRQCRVPHGVRPGAPPLAPVSHWVETNRELYETILGKGKADILVVPFQVQGYGIGRIERAVMTADLAYSLGSRVADPFLVARALGEGRRRINEAEILELARRLEARTVVVGYVGHLDRKSMNVSIQVWPLDESSVTSPRASRTQRDWRAVAFSHEVPPFLAFHGMLPDVIEKIAVKPAAGKPSAAARQKFPERLYAPPLSSVSARSPAVAPSSILLLFGALAPSAAELSRERLLERALVTSMRSDGDHYLARFTQAYALMQLRHRPAALKMLQGFPQPSSRAMAALLNGNLPKAEAALKEVKGSYERLLLDVALQDLRQIYGRAGDADLSDAMRLFGKSFDDWSSLVSMRYADADWWSVQGATELKEQLDEVFPVPRLEAASIVKGNAILGSRTSDVAMDIATGRHLRKIAQQLTAVACCGSASARASELDLLWLMEAAAESRLVKSLNLLIHVQALPQQAIERLDEYRPFFSGHPLLAAAEAQAAVDLSYMAADDVRETWIARMEENAALAVHFRPGQNRVAWTGLTAMGIPSPPSEMAVDAFGYDYPRRPFWPGWFIGSDSDPGRLKQLLEESLAYSRSDSEPLRQLHAISTPAQRQALAARIAGRFVKAAGQQSAKRLLPGAPGSADERVRQLRADIAADPIDWRNYEDLGALLIQTQGAYEEAARVFLSYPGFDENAPGNPVALSNHAYAAGSLLYWQGRPDLARALYEISAGLDTGSQAGMASAMRLHLLSGDFAAAAALSLQRAQRYPNAYAYRDYLSLLHAMGYGEEAWLGFSRVASEFSLPQVWVSALASQRKDGLDEPAVRKWLLRPEIRQAKHGSQQFALGYAILWNATDRIPPADLGELVAQLEGEPQATIDADGLSLLRPHPLDPSANELVRPSALRATHPKRLPEGTRIRSSLVYFGEAYALVRRGRFEQAVDSFVAMAERYPIEERSETFAMGYFAYAAARSGDRVGLETFLDSGAVHHGFDYWLAKAFFLAARKDSDAAEAALKQAFYHRPHTDYRPVLTEYQYAEACEWLYRDTGDSRFLNLLLDWTRKHQKIQPTQAWAYAMQFTYERSAAERERTLAMTLYLDPQSDRIRTAKAAEVAKAREWLEKNNPFLRRGIESARKDLVEL